MKNQQVNILPADFSYCFFDNFPMPEEKRCLPQKVKQHNHRSQNHQHDTGCLVQGLWFCFIGKEGGDSCPDKGEDYAQGKNPPVRRSADGKVGNCPGQRRKGHNKYACANRCL